MSLSDEGRSLESLSEVKCILESIQRRDPAAAWDASINHIHKAESAAFRVLRDIDKINEERHLKAI
jgi:hypothetical protein